ncbi:MAG: hypothetical protein AAFP77_20005 [Bacteroidota bacterium]
MERERRSLWIIIIVLFFVGVFKLTGTRVGLGLWELAQAEGRGGWWRLVWWYLVGSPAVCALISAVVYALLHYRRRHLTLWLMALQMIVILLVSYYPFFNAPFLIVAWMMLLSVVLRSKPRERAERAEQRSDLLDDI